MESGVPRDSPVSFTGRAEARRPGPRGPFHSQGQGTGRSNALIRGGTVLLAAKAAGSRSEGSGPPLGLGFLLHLPDTQGRTGPTSSQACRGAAVPRCAPPTARGERAGRRGASGHLCARTQLAPLPPIGSGARPHRLWDNAVGGVAPRARRALRRGGGLGRELSGWGSARRGASQVWRCDTPLAVALRLYFLCLHFPPAVETATNADLRVAVTKKKPKINSCLIY